MSDTKYDSVLVGYTEEPRFFDGNFSSMTVKLKINELKEMIDKYATPVQKNGDGGNVWLKLAMSKNGKPYATVYDPNSEAAKEKRAEKQAQKEAVSDDVPF
jgi:hypothetical protein